MVWCDVVCTCKEFFDIFLVANGCFTNKLLLLDAALSYLYKIATATVSSLSVNLYCWPVAICVTSQALYVHSYLIVGVIHLYQCI